MEKLFTENNELHRAVGSGSGLFSETQPVVQLDPGYHGPVEKGNNYQQ